MPTHLLLKKTYTPGFLIGKSVRFTRELIGFQNVSSKRADTSTSIIIHTEIH